MQNENQQTGTVYSGGDSVQTSQPVGGAPVSLFNPEALSNLPTDSPSYSSERDVVSVAPSGMMRKLLKWGGLVIMLALLLVAVVLSFNRRDKNHSAITSPAANFDSSRQPLDSLAVKPGSVAFSAEEVTINGLLKLNDGLLVTPSLQPSTPQPGQLYYDQGSNVLGYFNGSEFVFLDGNDSETNDVVQQIAGLTGQVALGSGLAVANGQLVNGGVLSIQGQTGDVTFTAGAGITIDGTTIRNDGVVSVSSGSPSLLVSDDGNGNVTITPVGGGSGTVASTGGTSGRIAKFTGAQTIEDSLLSESGATVTVGGNLNIAGSITLSSPLSVANGGTGVGTLGANGVLVGNGASAITSVVAGAAGLCLVSTAGAPTWATCNPPSSTVSSLNGLTGTLTIANATGLVNTITIDDASTSAKGIAQFNGTNFSVSGGNVNTIQNISTGSSPMFNSLTLSGNLTVQGGTSTLGTVTQAGSIVLSDGSSNTVTIVADNLGANRIYTLPDAGGDATLCVTAGNCIGGGGSAPNTADYLVTSLNGTLSNERALASGSNIALTDGGANANLTVATVQNPTFTTSVTTPVLQSSGALVISSASGNTIAVNAATTIELQDSTNVTGALDVSVALNVGTADAFAVNASGAVTAAAGITSSGTIIFSGLNCTGNANGGALTTNGSGQLMCSDDDGGAGGGISGAGTSGTIPVFNGASNITNSIITQSGTTITVAGDLVLGTDLTVSNGGTGASSFTSNGILYGNNTGAVQVTAAGTGGQVLVADAGGVPTFVSFTGDVVVASNGATTIQANSVALGTDTTGDFVSNLGALTGLNTSGNSGEGSTPTLSVSYGAIANTAVQGNVTLTCPSGTGNLTGGGTSITLGTGGSCGNLSTVQNPTFTTSVTTPNLIFTGAGNNGSLVIGNLGQGTIYTLPDPGQAAVNICLSTGNCATAGVAGGDLTGTYPNPTIASFQGTDLDISSPLAGHILIYNNTNSAWENHAVSSDIAISETGVATIQSNAVALGGDTTGNYVIGLTAGNGVSVGGSAGEGWSPSVAVLYGSSANTAVQGNTSITVSAGTNLTGGGSITLGAGGAVTLDVANSPTFSGTLVVQGATATIGTSSQAGSVVLNDGSSNTGTIQTGALGQDTTYTLPDPGGAAATICLTTGNCAGSGSGVTTPGGTADRLSKFTGSQTIDDSLVSDDGSTVTITGTGNFVVQGGTSTLGTLSQAGTLAVSDGSNHTISIVAAGVSGNRTLTLPETGGPATFCMSTGNCIGGGGGGAPADAEYLVLSLHGSLSNERALTSGGNISFTDAGSNGSLTVATVQNPTFTTSVTTPALQSSGALVISSGSGTVAIDATTTIELQDSTNVTGILDVSASLNVGTGNAFQVNSGGAIVAAAGITSSGTIIFSALDCTTFTNGGTLTTNGSGQLSCANDDGSPVNTITGTGTNGTIALFNGTNTLTDSVITQSGSVVTITGSLTLTTDLTVSNGGTGASSFTSNGVLYGGGSGAIQVTAAGTSGQVLVADGSGVPTFVSFSGDVAVTSGGATTIQANSVALGTDTAGDYVTNLGSLTGLSTSGNSGEGSTPTLSVLYGSSANTAVQGNTTLTCPSGTGNLTGGGTSITLGTGGSCANLSTVNNPTFSTSVTTPQLILTGAGSNGTLQIANLGQSTVYTLPDPVGPTATICLTSGNCTAIGSAGGDLTGTYPNPTIAELQGTTLTISSIASGNILQYNGTAWVNQSISGDVVLNSAGVATIQANSIVLGTDTTGDYIANLGALTGLNTSGNSGEGSTPTLSVAYGSSANTAVQGNTTLTCPSGTGNLTGGGTSITLGTGGSCGNIAITNSPTFTGTLTVSTIDTSSALTIGDVAQTFTLQGNAASEITADDSGNTTTVGFATPSADTTIDFPALVAGNYTVCTSSGNCGGVGATLQTAYANSSNPEIVLDATRGALTVRDNSTPLGAKLLEVQNNDASTTYFAVTSSGVEITGTNISSGNINTTGGAIQTAGTDRISSGGNLVNIGTVTTSGAINSQTISSAANFTGTVTIQGTNALTLGATGISTGAVLFKGSTAASGTITLDLLTSNPANNTISLPNETGTICTTGSICAGYAPSTGSGSYATRALDNLASVNINAALGFQSNQAANINFNGAAAAAGNLLSITGQTAGSTAQTGGGVTIQGGTGTTTGAGGTTTIRGGDAAATGTNGTLTLDAGSGATSPNGTINLGIANASTINVGNQAMSSGIQNINIGGNNTSGGTTNITIGTGTLATGGTTTLQAKGVLTLTGGAASTFNFAGNTLGITSSNFNVSTGGVLNVAGGSAGFQINGAATAGNFLRGNGTSFVSSAIQPGDIPVCSGTCNYIANQIAGAQTSSNFWVSDIGRAGVSLQAPIFDTANGVALGIGTNNATAINLNQSSVVAATKTFSVTSGLTSLTSNTVGDALNVSNSTSTGNIALFKDNATNVVTIADGGITTFRPSVASTTAFQVQNTTSQSILNVDTTNKALTVSSVAASSLLAPKVDYATATSPLGVATADFDKDGDADMAVANTGSTSVSIFMSNGDGTFATKVDYTTATNPRYVATADFDKDGDADMAVTNGGSNSVSVFINNGSGVFAAKVDYTTGTNPRNIIAADFDKDGDADMATTNFGSTNFSVFINNGSGVFAAKVDYTTGTTPFGITSADFDKDGDADVAVANNDDDTISIFMNNGSGTFAAKVDYNAFSTTISGEDPNGLVSADFDKDGDVDLATVHDTSESLAVLFNAGNGTFGTVSEYVIGATPRNLATVDIDKDGDMDILTTNEGPDTISLLKNNGNGTFGAKVDFATGINPYSVVSADFDKDGDMDVAATNGGATSISVLLNVTLGVSPLATPTLTLYSGGVNDSLQIKSSDNRRLFAVDARGNTTIGEQSDGEGTLFAPHNEFTTGEHPYGITNADFDKDGDADMAVVVLSDDAVSVLLNNGNGIFAAHVSYAVGSTPISVASADLDKDSDMDLIVTNEGDSTVSVLINNGSGVFAAKVDYAVGTFPEGLVTADLDKDGDTDIAVANSSADTLSILKNNGAGTFAAKVDYTTGDAPYHIAAGDFNKDGNIDLVTANQSSNNASVLMNSGTGTFPAKVDYSAAVGAAAVKTADFDKDGDIDFATGNDDSVSVFLNNGAGTFAADVEYTISNAHDMAVGDFDKDGSVDIAVANDDSPSYAEVLLNNGNGTFGTVIKFEVGYYPIAITAADFDKDGDIDLATANESSDIDTVSVLLNNTLSSTRFKVLSGDGVPAFSVDTNNALIQIGSGVADATGTLLALDTKNTTGDPVGVNGAMYYNSTYGRFRCFQNSAWVDCISGSPHEYLRAEMRTNQTTTSGPGSTTQVTVGNHVDYDAVDASAGGSIGLDTTTTYTTGGGASSGRFTLAAGKTYKLSASLPWSSFSSASAYLDFGWHDVTSGVALGSSGSQLPATLTGHEGKMAYAEAIFTPTIATIVEVRLNSVLALSQIGLSTSRAYPSASIEVISDGGAGGASAAEYMRAEHRTPQTTGQSKTDSDDHIDFDTVQASSGSSITLDRTTAYTESAGASRGRFTLAAGKTYKMTTTIPFVEFSGPSAAIEYSWYNVTTGTQIGNTGGAIPDNGTTATSEAPYAEVVISPSVTTIVEVRVVDAFGVEEISHDVPPYLLYSSAFIEVLSDGTKVAQFQGATASAAGQSGFVAGPAAGQEGSLLLGNGQWSDALEFITGSNALVINTQAIFNVNVDQGGDAVDRYYRLGTIGSGSGEFAIEGILAGHELTEGKALVNVKYSARSGFMVLGSVFGLVNRSDIVVYYDGVSTYTVWLKTDEWALANIELKAATGADALYDGTYQTSTPSGTLTNTLSTDAGGKLLKMDNTGSISLGAADATGAVLILDSKSGTGDSGVTATNGAMYYNSTDQKFRCYQNSIWVNCLNGLNDAVTVEDVENGSYQANITSWGVATTGGTYADAAVTFVVPPSGKVMIHYEGQLQNGTANMWTAISPEVRTGAVIGSGTIVSAAQGEESCQVENATAGSSHRAACFMLLTGLTVGSTYNVRLLHNVEGGTATIFRRQVVVEPVW